MKKSKVLITAFLVIFTFSVSGANFLDGPAIGVYDESKNAPLYKSYNGSFSAEKSLLNIGSESSWLEAGKEFRGDSAIVMSVTKRGDYVGQVWDGSLWVDLKTISTSGKKKFEGVDVAYESQSGDGIVVYTNLQTTPKYRVYDGGWSPEESAVSTSNSDDIKRLEVSSNPVEDELMLVTSRKNEDIDLQIWNGDSWGNHIDVGDQPPETEPYATTFTENGEGIAVWENGTSTTPEYRVWNGSWQNIGQIESIGEQLRWAELDSHENKTEAVLATIDANGDMEAQVWNGTDWNNHTLLAGSVSSGTEAIDVEYVHSGDAMVMYSDGSTAPKYRLWNGTAWSNEKPSPTVQGTPQWLELSSHPNTDEVLANTKDGNSQAYLQIWNGSSWTGNGANDQSNNNGRIAGFYSVADNELPELGGITGPGRVKAGSSLSLDMNGVRDAENDSLELYCGRSRDPSSSNSILDTAPEDDAPYNLNYDYTAEDEEGNKTVFCRVFDGFGYSQNQNVSYKVDGTPPSTSLNSVAGDKSATFTDTDDDSQTEIVVEGEDDMRCRYSQTDESYSSMPSSNSFSISGDIATATPDLAQGTPDIYVSCEDSVGNEQDSSNNLDITSLVIDFTPPTTFEDAVTDVKVPPYSVTFTEQDNTDGDPETEYCLSSSCTPDISIDDGQAVSFDSSQRGENILRYNSTDFVGNTQSTVIQNIYINLLPELKDVSDNASTIQGGGTVKVETNSSDADSRGRNMTMYVCSSLGASASGCDVEEDNLCTATGTSNLSCLFQSENDTDRHDYFTYLYDTKDEGAEENPVSGGYTTDSTPPDIIITDPGNQTYTQSEIPFSIETDEPVDTAILEVEGVNSTMEKLDSDSFTESRNLNDGQYTAKFYVNDTVSNINTEEVSFTIDTSDGDTTPPSLTVRSPLNNTFIRSSISLNVSSNEDLSSASYKLGDDSFDNLGNTSTTSWNQTIDPQDGEYEIIFNGTDLAGNTEQTDIYKFTYDTNSPTLESSGIEDADNTGQTTCHSRWSDPNLDTGKVYENATDTNHSVSFQKRYLNYSFSPEPGKVECRFYATDRAGNTNSAQIIETIQDVKKPVISDFTIPSEEEADPKKKINFTAKVSDYAVDTVKLQYNKTSDRKNRTMFNNSGTFQGNFTGEKGVYTVRVFANDTSGNIRYSEKKSLSVKFEEELSVADTLEPPRTTRLKDQNTSMSLGNITLENEGDLDLNLSASSNREWIKLDNSENRDVNLSPEEKVELNVTANTSKFPTGEFEFNISITGNKSKAISDSILIQKERGPSLDTGFRKFSSQLTKGKTYEYVIETENAGTTNAELTNIQLDVPESFTIISGTKNRSVGEMLVGGTSTSTVKLRPTESDAEYNFTAISKSTEDSSSVTRTVAVGTPPEPEVVEETNVVSEPSGGSSDTAISGGSAQLTQEQSDRLFETEENFKVVRGTNESFSINFTNPIDYKLNNVSVQLDGFLSQYLQLENSDLGIMEINETQQIELNVTAPNYYTSERKELLFTITGVGETDRQKFNLTERKTVNLLIREISRDTAEELINQSKAELNQFSGNGYQTDEIEGLVSEMETALNENKYGRVKKISQEVENTLSIAKNTRETIQELERSIQMSEQRGIEAERSKRILRLAEESIERGDFETASSRLTEAENLYALETKGEFDLANYVIRNKFKTVGGSAATLFLTLFSLYRFKLNRMENRLENLKSERTSINDEIKELQKEAFRTDEISLKEYEKELSSHKDRLMEISEKQVSLVSKKSAWENFRNKKSRLKQEEQRIRDMIQDTQRNYIDREQISSESFEKRERKYRERLTEIKEELAEIEAHEKIGGGSYLP